MSSNKSSKRRSTSVNNDRHRNTLTTTTTTTTTRRSSRSTDNNYTATRLSRNRTNTRTGTRRKLINYDEDDNEDDNDYDNDEDNETDELDPDPIDDLTISSSPSMSISVSMDIDVIDNDDDDDDEFDSTSSLMNVSGLIDLFTAPKPFKSSIKKKFKSYKSAKQLITTQTTMAINNHVIANKLSPDEIKKVNKSISFEFQPLWMRICAPPSIRPQRKYCDITGLPTNYTDPISGLQFYDSTVYQYIKSLPTARVQKCLAIRNKAVVI